MHLVALFFILFFKMKMKYVKYAQMKVNNNGQMYKQKLDFRPHRHKPWRPWKVQQNPTCTKLRSLKNKVVQNIGRRRYQVNYSSNHIVSGTKYQQKIENSESTYTPTK